MLRMESTTILFFLAALPVILILMYIYNKDKTKEPFGLLIKFFGLGILSCFLVLLVSFGLEKFLPFMNHTTQSSFTDTILYCFIGVALVEEVCKWIMVYLSGYNNKEFDEVYDIVVYSVFVSLGFAFFENIVYVFGNMDFLTAILRAVSAVPGHACDAIFMGYYLSVAKICLTRNSKKLERKNIFLSIAIPALLHGIYDFCLMSGCDIFVFVFLIFVVILYKLSISKLNEIALTNKKIKDDTAFCSNCGARLEGQFCERCGKPRD